MPTHKTKCSVLVATLTTVVVLFVLPAMAQRKEKQRGEPPLIAALNAYSFSDLLSAKNDRTKQQVYTLFNLLDWCHSKNIKALDPTAYFFPTYPDVPSDEYLLKFKEEAKSLGIVISGTGVRNNFASPDPQVRAEGVALAKKWIEAAPKMGANCSGICRKNTKGLRRQVERSGRMDDRVL